MTIADIGEERATSVQKMFPGVKVRLMLMTKRKCEKLIGNQISNRPVSEIFVKTYAADMLAGAWMIAEAAIIIDKTGQMINGQHRCLACIETGVPFVSIVLWGVVKEKIIHTLDTGRTRSISEFLGFHGYKNASLVASIARIHNKILKVYPPKSKAYKAAEFTPMMSRRVMRTFLANHPVVIETAEFIAANRDALNIVINPSILGGAVSVAAELVDWELAFEFGGKMATGENLKSPDPILRVRNKLLKNSMSKSVKLTVGQKLGLIQRGWGYWVTGTPLERASTAQGAAEVLRMIQPTQSTNAMYPKRQSKSATES